MQTFSNISEYISQFPVTTQEKLQEIYTVIKQSAPKATEKISYGMPTFYLQSNLVHFAAYKNHIGFYPAPSGLDAFKEEIEKYKHSKGAVQFPLDKPLPKKLIERIVKYRMQENLAKAALKQKK
ncbi:MAG: DUF1801 domain-containing protein [Bacteroidetes bacterium]|nr:DUF1801 domain-containing protein [Bacteroidota bacterium]MBP7399437.1 DUF1801 domain-containing protein [Chitinophagales bacterium]MBK7107598.1 DUF1801 domain-containing protein [Bacteroidota bacterium]MBP8754343.1 DUF1801 domain-containing protein [Chitinophagales bacterium]MBP9188238.1 DUF1801 domain-containing protein [Chitinophagales bacterium]